MGRGDSKRTRKMRRVNAMKKLKARIKAKILGTPKSKS